MKKTIICFMFVFVLGVFLGIFFIHLKTRNTLDSENKELAKWELIKKYREKSAEKIYKKACYILANLTVPGHSYYSNNGLRITSWGELFNECGISIFYRKKLVFNVTSGFIGVGEVHIFHPGKWVEKMEKINVEKRIYTKNKKN